MLMISREIVESHLRSAYGLWHGCRMSSNPRSKNFLHPEDIARGLKEGQLCDDCEGMVQAHMTDIIRGVGQP